MFALNYEQATQMVTLLSTVRYTQSVQRHIFHPKSESGHLLIGHNSVVAAAGGNTWYLLVSTFLLNFLPWRQSAFCCSRRTFCSVGNYQGNMPRFRHCNGGQRSMADPFSSSSLDTWHISSYLRPRCPAMFRFPNGLLLAQGCFSASICHLPSTSPRAMFARGLYFLCRTSSNLVFMNNLGGSTGCSGVWTICGGNGQSYSDQSVSE